MTSAALLLSLSALAAPAVEDLPPLSLARGLPPHKVCSSNWFRASEYWVEVHASGVWQPAHYLRSWYCDAVWGYAAGATDPGMAEHDRREALQKLSDLVGWRAVLTGELPPPLPLEYFEATPDLPRQPEHLGRPTLWEDAR